MATPQTSTQDPLPAFKLSRLIPRILRSKGWRQEKFSEVRLDQIRQRFDRINAYYLTYHSYLNRKHPSHKNFLNIRSVIISILRNLSQPERPLRFWSPPAWREYRKTRAVFGKQATELSKGVQDLNVLLFEIGPFFLVERMIQFALFDLKAISSTELYDKARRGLEKYESGESPSADTNQRPGFQPNPLMEQDIRARSVILVQETRRQSFSLAQLEVMRDGVAMELLVASTRLILMLGLIMLGLWIWAADSESQPLALAAVLCTIGGVTGSVISAIIRIGKMQDNLDASRALSLLNGASRSIYLVPFIGCLVAFILFGFSAAEVRIGIIDFGLFNEDEDICNFDSCNFNFSPKILIRSFVLGVASGFSERLVHDLVDRFNKPPGKTS